MKAKRNRAAARARWALLCAAACGFLLASGARARAEDAVRASCAASLRETLEAVAKRFEAARPGTRVLLNFGASNLLARQIEAGAPADLFISAGAKPMNDLAGKKRIDAPSRFDLLGNELVAVARKEFAGSVDSPAALADARFGRIAVAEPGVPAGAYAEEYLKNERIWEKLSGRVARLPDVRAALAAVEAGHAQLGWVYATDAAIAPGLQIVWRAPAEKLSPIRYPAALTAEGARNAAAREFLAELKTAKSGEVFAAAGFAHLPGGRP